MARWLGWFRIHWLEYAIPVTTFRHQPRYISIAKFQIPCISLGNASNTKSQQAAAHSVYTRPKLGYFTRAQQSWEHNCSIEGLNQRIGSSAAIETRWEPRTMENKKSDERARDFFLERGVFDTFFFLSPATRRIRERISQQAAKVRTKLSAKPGSQRCRPVALSGHWYQDLWKQQEVQSNKYSELAQSRVLHCLPPLELWSQPLVLESRTAKLEEKSRSSSIIRQRLYL